jgi:hypothetical protein
MSGDGGGLQARSPPRRRRCLKVIGVIGQGSTDDQVYFRSIVDTLQTAKDWLFLGPGTAKKGLLRHVQAHHPKLADRVVGVETVDRPSDAEIEAHARSYFRIADPTAALRSH